MEELRSQHQLLGRLLSLRWSVFVVLVFCAVAPPSCLAGYHPPCLDHDSTWTTRSGKTQGFRFLNDVEAAGSRGEEYCTNPLGPLSPENESQRPPAAENVQASYYTSMFIYEDADGPAAAKFNGSVWSALRITFALAPEAAGKITGVLSSMRVLSPERFFGDSEYGIMNCQAYNFGLPLTDDALLDEQGKPLQLYFDCFRGQRPGLEYEFTIRTLPVLDTSGDDPNDTVVTFRYRFPSCFTIPGDCLCIDSSDSPPTQVALCSHWKPQFFTATAGYSALTVVTEIGPEECGFDAFRFAAHAPEADLAGVVPWTNGFTQVDVANTSHFETFAYGRNITYIEVVLSDVRAGQRVVVLAPWPSQNTCFRNDGTPKACGLTQSVPVTVLENPCLSGPCSSFEVCKPKREEFSCHCKAGYIRDYPRCIEHPCEVLNGENETVTPYNPCGSGRCIVSSNKRSYTCSCHGGLVFVDGTCQAHPCVSNPCGHHGFCRRSDQSAGSSITSVSFACDCDFGYHYSESSQSCQVSIGTMVAVILTGVFSALLLMLLIHTWRRRRGSRNVLLKSIPCLRKNDISNDCIVDRSSIPSRTPSQDSTQSQGVYQQVPERSEIISPMTRIKTVLFSSSDHPLHDEAVQRLADFLRENCMCDVILPMWCTQDIAGRGLSEWLTFVLDWSDKVILLCSRGAMEGWQSHSSSIPHHARVFTQAVSFLLRDNASVGLPAHCCVAYLDYSSKTEDIPAPLSVGAVYRLMKHMDALFFRLHDMKQWSPEWQLRAKDLEEGNYATRSPEGACLHRALQTMRDLRVAEPDWYARLHHGVESQTDRGDSVDGDDDDSPLQQFLTTTAV